MKSKLFVLLTTSLLIFSSCNSSGNSLKMTEITADDSGIHWTAVEGASKYSVVVNDEKAVEVTTPNFGFATVIGDYTVKVTAFAKDGGKSDTASFTYEAVYTSLDSVSAANGVITWGNYAGKGIEVKGEKEESFVAVNGNSYTVTVSDLYVVRASSGYKDNKYYIDNPSQSIRQKGILVSIPATGTYVIEDGSEADDYELAEIYTVKRYPNNAWVDTSASIILDSSNEGISDNSCIKLNYWHHSIWYKYTKAISVDNRFDTFSFKVKGGKTTFTSLTFEIVDHLIIGNQDLAGVYISYQINPVETQWVNYSVSLDDPNWLVDYNGGKHKFSELQPVLTAGGYTINSLADMMPFFKQFSFRVNATADDNYSNAYMWFDDVALSNTGEATKTNKPIVLGSNYAIECDAFKGNATFEDDGTGTLNFKMKSNGSNVEIPVTYEKGDGEIRLVSTTSGYDFDATFVSDSNGASFVLDSVTGSASGALTNFKASRYTMIDDFNSYTETGVGYDNNHKDPSARSGLRANYFADWYTSSSDYAVSPIGDENWKLVGSTDYLDLVKNAGMDATGNCVKVRGSSNALRYGTYGLLDGSAKPFSGKYFSFFVKGASERDVDIKVRVFSVNKLTAQNHVSDEVSVVLPATIGKNSEWHEVRLELNENIPYYGFTIAPQSGSGSAYFYIDNINVYGDLSPWAN